MRQFFGWRWTCASRAERVHYSALRQPLDATNFIAELDGKMRPALRGLDDAVAAGDTGGASFSTRHGEPWISVPQLGKLTERLNLGRVKQEVARWFGTIELLGFLKEADFLTGFTSEFASVASREVTRREVVRRRLLNANPTADWARLKNIGSQRLYLPDADAGAYARPGSIRAW